MRSRGRHTSSSLRFGEREVRASRSWRSTSAGRATSPTRKTSWLRTSRIFGGADERDLRPLQTRPGAPGTRTGGAGHRRTREGEAARAREGIHPGGARHRLLPHPALLRGRGGVSRHPRAAAGRPLRALRARPLPGEAGEARRGRRALPHGELLPPAERGLSPRPRSPRSCLRAVVQRVSAARVAVSGETVAEIGAGLCVLLGVGANDEDRDATRLAGKVARLRIFENEESKFDRSLLDAGGRALVVSQFTLIADTAKGNRPSFAHAAPPERAEPLYEAFCAALETEGVEVARGVFGARMDVELVNDGPVTIILET